MDDENNIQSFARERIDLKVNVMDYLEYKGYKGTVEYSKDDDCLFGKVLGMGNKALILYEGTTLDGLRSDFQAGIDSYINACIADGVEPYKGYSGSLNVRISPETHSKIAAIAGKAGISINAFISQTLNKAVAMY